MTDNELRYCNQLRAKDTALRAFLSQTALSDQPDARLWFGYVETVKDALGNISNDLGFLATLLAKEYLAERFGVQFDAAEKAQGAPGPDIEVRTPDGSLIRCEIKTTKPYQPGFGAAQKKTIMSDLQKLCACTADHKLMLVTHREAFDALCRPYYAAHTGGVEIVNLLTRQVHRHV